MMTLDGIDMETKAVVAATVSQCALSFVLYRLLQFFYRPSLDAEKRDEHWPLHTLSVSSMTVVTLGYYGMRSWVCLHILQFTGCRHVSGFFLLTFLFVGAYESSWMAFQLLQQRPVPCFQTNMLVDVLTFALGLTVTHAVYY